MEWTSLIVIQVTEVIVIMIMITIKIIPSVIIISVMIIMSVIIITITIIIIVVISRHKKRDGIKDEQDIIHSKIVRSCRVPGIRQRDQPPQR